MIAEIHRKISSSGSNLSEKLEDELTGNFFGNLRYLPFNRGLKQILAGQVFSEFDTINRVIGQIDINEWDIDFWKRSEMGLGEIDACVEFDHVIIGFEVKLYSGLSSDDQLNRESNMLVEWGRNKEKILILIADEEESKLIYRNNLNKLNHGVLFGHISWQKALEGLAKVITINPYEEKIISDLIYLLKGKGFERFTGFNIDCKITKDHWKFTVKSETKFNFINMNIIVGDESYEFR